MSSPVNAALCDCDSAKLSQPQVHSTVVPVVRFSGSVKSRRDGVHSTAIDRDRRRGTAPTPAAGMAAPRQQPHCWAVASAAIYASVVKI
jgi:hypothetical protein